MAVESIGVKVTTAIPSLASDADIQTALRIYHYGEENFPYNDSGRTLNANSIAGRLDSLKTTVDSLQAASGISSSIINAKGDIVIGSANDTAAIIQVGLGNAGKVLTIDYTAANYLAWKSPDVTLDNAVTFTNKTLTAPKITDASFIADSSGNEYIAFTKATTAVNEITVGNAATGNSPSISATGGDTNISLNLVSKGTGTVRANGIDIVTTSGAQTLTNKTISSITTNGNTLNFPAISATDTVATLGATQTLVAKTITVDNAYFTFTDTNGSKNFSLRANASLSTGGTFYTPPTADTLVGIGATQTLSNKTLASPVVTTSITSTDATLNLFPSVVTTLNIGSASTNSTFTGVVTIPNPTASVGLKIGGRKIYVGNTTPTSPAAGDIWLRTGN